METGGERSGAAPAAAALDTNAARPTSPAPPRTHRGDCQQADRCGAAPGQDAQQRVQDDHAPGDCRGHGCGVFGVWGGGEAVQGLVWRGAQGRQWQAVEHSKQQLALTEVEPQDPPGVTVELAAADGDCMHAGNMRRAHTCAGTSSVEGSSPSI